MKVFDVKAVSDKLLGFVVIGTTVIPLLTIAGTVAATAGAALVAAVAVYTYFTGVPGTIVTLTDEEMKEMEDEDV